MIQYKNAGCALLINLYFIFLCLGLSHLRYGAIDDYFMAGILSGIYGEDYNVHLPFVNAIYGYILLPFYYLFPKVSWYYVGEVFSIYISLSLITYFIMHKVGLRWGGIIGTVLCAAYAKDFYIVLQFTQCAAALSVAGMLSVFEGFDTAATRSNYVKSLLFVILGIILLWWGSFMRWNAFLMGLPFFGAAICFRMKEWKSNWRLVVATILVMSIGALGFHLFNKSLYQESDYKYFMDFQPVRSLLGDGSFYNEQAIYEDLQEMGAAPNDFDLLKKWCFYDKDVFAPESLRIIESMINKYTSGLPGLVLPMRLLQGLSRIAGSPIFYAWIVFGLVMYFSNRRKVVYLWLSLFLFFAMLSYLLNINRPVYRVQLGLLLYATVVPVTFWNEMPKLSRKVFYVLFFLFIGVVGVAYFSNRNEFRNPNSGSNVEMSKIIGPNAFGRLFQYMDSLPDSILFVTEMGTYMAFSDFRYPPYLTEPMGSWQRIVPMGFWTPYFPDVEEAFHKRGMSNPMKDLVKENVYYVTETKSYFSLVDYLETHHYANVGIDTIETFENVIVLKYFVVQDSAQEK